MIQRIYTASALFLLLLVFSCSGITENKMSWDHPLYMANTGYWRQRIPVIIKNNTGRQIMGFPIQLKIGKGEGQVPLTGESAQSIRIVTGKHAELIFRLNDRDGNLIEKGPVPENCTITLPIECPADTVMTHYIYFDNPLTWPIGDFLKTESKVNDSITANVLKIEKLSLNQTGKSEKWFGDFPEDRTQWQSRAEIKTINLTEKKNKGMLVCVDLEDVLKRLHTELDKNSAMEVTDGTHTIKYFKTENFVFFNQDIPSRTEKTNYVYFNSGNAIGNNFKSMVETGPVDIDKSIIFYSDFESKELLGWKGDILSDNIRISQDSKEGKGSIQLEKTVDKEEKEIRLERTLAVNPGKLYFTGAWMKLSDKIDAPDEFKTGIGQRTLRIQFINSKGENVGASQKLAVIPERYSDFPGTWMYVHNLMKAPENADSVKLQLVNTYPGSVWYDNILFTEVISGTTGALTIERKASKDLQKLTVWQEDPVIKVFQDDLPPKTIAEVSISAARNEAEPLQLVIRSPQDYNNLQIKVDPASDQNGNKLNKIEIGVVGYIPINYPSNYYGARDNPTAWRIKYPFGRESGSDGWVGMWPDPIMPFQNFDLKAFTTQPVWIELKIPKNAAAGDYTGKIQLIQNGSTIQEIPYKVHVWDFELPDRSHFTAIYSGRNELWKLLSENRLASGRIAPNPTWKNVNGNIIYDFTEYDKAASLYFDTLKFNYSYSPNFFSLFGWGNPPAVKFGEAPYPGDYPYEGADRSKLRPAFKKVYQSALRNYWNHLKQKGWADKVLLYISDEPHTTPAITAQMRALCDMIHEVDPKIPVYVSSWWYRPEYGGYINVWGVSSHGSTWGRPVPLSDYEAIKKTGGRLWFTTDGKLCTDTPYLGFERMTPYYAFKVGAEAYEFWQSTFFTFNPFDYGWHNHIRQSSTPGRVSWVRYPNGDGYIVYSGNYIGLDGYVGSLRLKLSREGVEDYEYLYHLNSLVSEGIKEGKDVSMAQKALDGAKDLAPFPTSEGRFSTEYLPDPYAIMRVRKQVAEAIVGLEKQLKSN